MNLLPLLTNLNRELGRFYSWIINKSGDHYGVIDIHWLVYTFPWRQLESTRGRVPFMWPAALCSGLVALSYGWAELWRNLPTLKEKKKKKTLKSFSSSLNMMVACRPSNSHGLTVKPPVWDTIPRPPGFTSNSHGELIPTLAPSLGYIIYGSTYSGKDKTQAALRARGLASLD